MPLVLHVITVKAICKVRLSTLNEPVSANDHLEK